mmetsp:Transcript_31699/g.64685  ORF Transcript_31699/g.64685 Transcript_31699/m.64685 type:complete len:440 (+) Transcript_31699:43-1362(+)
MTISATMQMQTKESAASMDVYDRLVGILNDEKNIYACSPYISYNPRSHDVDGGGMDVEEPENADADADADVNKNSNSSHQTSAKADSAAGIKRINAFRQIREKAIMSFYNLADHFDLPREVVSVAANLMDRVLSGIIPPYIRGTEISSTSNDEASSSSQSTDICLKDIRLVSMAAFNLATKSLVGRAIVFPKKGSGQVSIEEAELVVLRELHWRICYPTPLSIARDLFLPLILTEVARFVDVSDEQCLLDQIAYITELSVVDVAFLSVRPTSVALGSIMAVFDLSFTSIEESMEENKQELMTAIADAVKLHFEHLGFSCEGREVAYCHSRLVDLRRMQMIDQGVAAEKSGTERYSPTCVGNHPLLEATDENEAAMDTAPSATSGAESSQTTVTSHVIEATEKLAATESIMPFKRSAVDPLPRAAKRVSVDYFTAVPNSA